MITIDYTVSNEWRESWARINLAAASKTDLTFKVVLGDIIFVVDSIDFSARWGWIPIIDFAASMAQVANQLSTEGTANFEFTENDASLRFVKRGIDVEITATYHPEKVTVAAQELISALLQFARRVGSELLEKYPDLSLNCAFRELMPVGNQ